MLFLLFFMLGRGAVGVRRSMSRRRMRVMATVTIITGSRSRMFLASVREKSEDGDESEGKAFHKRGRKLTGSGSDARQKV